MSSHRCLRGEPVRLVVLVVLISCLRPSMLDGHQEGIRLCVTLRRGMTDLSKHNLTRVPSGISNDTEYLDLSENPLGQLSAAPFAGLSRLCFLKATHCRLRNISAHIFSHTPALKVLNLSSNQLAFIPQLPLTQLKIVDLKDNLYPDYRIPQSFASFKSLDQLSLGSPVAMAVNLNDFAPLANVRLRHMELGAETQWTNYDSGSLAKMKKLQKFSVHVSFCGNWPMFDEFLRDLNETGAESLRLVSLFPDSCNASREVFHNLRFMPGLQELIIENTWINSSFMEGLFKNVWLSGLQNVAMINITYNEDTQDGFQFHTINHTLSLQSVTFNGINHYQYRYPTFNMSFGVFSKITYIKFSGTGMNILPCKVFSAMPSLETLDLSDNLLSETGFWWFQCQQTSDFPKLRRLYLSKNRFSSLSSIASRMWQMQTLESLDLSFNSISLDAACDWPPQLTELSLANNNLGNSVFKFLSPNFRKVDLSKTGITEVTSDDLFPLRKLTHLRLSSNSIQVIPSDLLSPMLTSLHVNQNSITSISRGSLAGLPRLRTLKAGDNPFFCSCDSHWFVSALNKSLLVDWPLDYTCSTPAGFAGRPLVDYKPSELSCEAWLQASLALPVLLVVSAALVLLFYKYDGLWYAKMLWVWIQMKRRGKCSALKDISFGYHAFISYSHQDSDWVDRVLVPSLEGAGFSLCIHERDFVPGEWILDNIINCVESSYKTLFLLSKHFVQSEWCNYELFFAQHRSISIQEDSLVFILLEPIPLDSLPKRFLKLRSLLRQQTYLEWPKDECKQQVFWASLKSMLRMADQNLLKNVAEDILDTLPLIHNDVDQEAPPAV